MQLACPCQGNKHVGLGSGRELPDTLRVYYELTYGSGLYITIACYKLAEYGNTPSQYITILTHGIFIMGVYGTSLLV